MKRSLLFSLMACAVAPLWAQYDDIYSDYTREPEQTEMVLVRGDNPEEQVVEEPKVVATTSTRDIDEYNRQYRTSAPTEVSTESDESEDFSATQRIVKYHNADAVTINDPQYVYINTDNEEEETISSDAAASFAAGYLLGAGTAAAFDWYYTSPVFWYHPHYYDHWYYWHDPWYTWHYPYYYGHWHTYHHHHWHYPHHYHHAYYPGGHRPSYIGNHAPQHRSVATDRPTHYTTGRAEGIATGQIGRNTNATRASTQRSATPTTTRSTSPNSNTRSTYTSGSTRSTAPSSQPAYSGSRSTSPAYSGTRSSSPAYSGSTRSSAPSYSGGGRSSGSFGSHSSGGYSGGSRGGGFSGGSRSTGGGRR